MPTSEPHPLRVIGVGASAGGIDALTRVLTALPADVPHALLVVLHVPPSGHSVLPVILDRVCPLPVVAATDREPILPGHVYVAPPDRHLTVRRNLLALSGGARENGVRPAVDPLLRSLAAAHGPAAVGVVLSGALGDGSAGARAIAAAGGRVLVQDPGEALTPSMPLRAIAAAGPAAEVLGAAAIGSALAGMGAYTGRAGLPHAGMRS